MPFQKSYVNLPTVNEWARDSYAMEVDPISSHMLFLVQKLNDQGNQAKPIKLRLVSDLYFTLKYWIALREGKKIDPLMPTTAKQKAIDNLREPAIRALYEWSERALCEVLNCTKEELPEEISIVFGRDMSRLGRIIDLKNQQAFYATDLAVIEPVRMFFKNGRAYQFDWWSAYAQGGPLGSIVLAESKHAWTAEGFHGGLDTDYGNYVMTMDRDLYMFKHWLGDNFVLNGFYHSSYVAGKPVLSAGSMLIRGGIISAVCANSGHYRPKRLHMVNLLNCLQMHGVPLGNLEVLAWNGINHWKAPLYLATFQNIDLDGPDYDKNGTPRKDDSGQDTKLYEELRKRAERARDPIQQFVKKGDPANPPVRYKQDNNA